MSKFSVRNPLLLRAGLALLVVAVARVAVALGVIPAEWAVDEARVEQGFDALVFAWAWFSARRHVTPVADPRDNAGNQLVPVGRYDL
ncbi:hypothetical protein ACIBH1_45810 [Nonomuraea sp. NPDC050663]|uniref:hypothetical protein n=1 Tax=Nonomuraea sp. NPDC050663 TaxID=3364370 RepID=UPI0037A46D1A